MRRRPRRAGDVATSPATTAVSSVPFALLTHCGIYEHGAGHLLRRRPPLNDGHGNPPAGWGNPYQSGTITVAGSQAVFHDDNGHTVTFHERHGATSFLRLAPEASSERNADHKPTRSPDAGIAGPCQIALRKRAR